MQIVIMNGVGAKREMTRRLSDSMRAKIRFGPLTPFIDQTQQRNIGRANQSRRFDQSVKFRLRSGVQHLKLKKRHESGDFISRIRGSGLSNLVAGQKRPKTSVVNEIAADASVASRDATGGYFMLANIVETVVPGNGS